MTEFLVGVAIGIFICVDVYLDFQYVLADKAMRRKNRAEGVTDGD